MAHSTVSLQLAPATLSRNVIFNRDRSFEKMLYDQSQLLEAFIDAYQVTKKPEFAEVLNGGLTTENIYANFPLFRQPVTFCIMYNGIC